MFDRVSSVAGVIQSALLKKSQKLETVCLDRRRGFMLWRQAPPPPTIERGHEINSPASSTPASDGEQVYV